MMMMMMMTMMTSTCMKCLKGHFACPRSWIQFGNGPTCKALPPEQQISLQNNDTGKAQGQIAELQIRSGSATSPRNGAKSLHGDLLPEGSDEVSFEFRACGSSEAEAFSNAMPKEPNTPELRNIITLSYIRGLI